MSVANLPAQFRARADHYLKSAKAYKPGHYKREALIASANAWNLAATKVEEALHAEAQNTAAPVADAGHVESETPGGEPTRRVRPRARRATVVAEGRDGTEAATGENPAEA